MFYKVDRGVWHRWHVDVNVDAIEERARHPGIVALQLLRRAQTGALWIAPPTTWAPVQLAAQHFPSRLS
jgi:hypothetical protein